MTRPLPLFTQLRISSGGAAMVIWSWANYSSGQAIRGFSMRRRDVEICRGKFLISSRLVA